MRKTPLGVTGNNLWHFLIGRESVTGTKSVFCVCGNSTQAKQSFLWRSVNVRRVVMGCGSSKSVAVAENTNHTAARDKPKNDQNANALPSDPVIATRNDPLEKSTAADETNEGVESAPVCVGDRVHVSGYTGTVAFIGETALGHGTWVGVRLDRPHHQGNNGSFNGIEYFSCKRKHGLFTRPNLVFPHTDIGAIEESAEISLQTVIFIQHNIRRFLTKIRARKYQDRTSLEREIDAHVLKTPRAKEQSIESLSEYLTAPWDGERSKVYSVFRWISFNVEYDVDGFFGSGAKQSSDAQSVLSTRLSVCAGYANLFEALCKAVQLEVRTVSGYAKGYGHRPGQKAVGSNHAWNAVRVNGEWSLCDVTWGAGYIGEDMMFHRSPNTHTFLMDAEVAITDHMPEDAAWQLLDEPIAREEFEKLVVPSGHLTSMGVELQSHRYAEYHVDADHVEIELYSPSLKIISGSLKDAAGKDLGQRKRVLVRACGANKLKVKAEFPAPGSYRLDINVRVNGELQDGVRYLLHAAKGVGAERGGFPQLGGQFHSAGFSLLEPLESVETSDGRAEIRLGCYSGRFGTLYAFVEPEKKSDGKKKKTDLQLTRTEKTASGFLVSVHIADPGIYKVNMFAKYREGNEPDLYVCTYYINAHAGVEPIAGFPRLSDIFHAWGLELVDPVENIFTDNGVTAVKIEVPEGISIIGNLKRGQDGLDNSLCCAKKDQSVTTVSVQTPDAGLFKLNIFGSKEPNSKQEYLCSFALKAGKAANDNPGFPRLSRDFTEWGLALADQRENIVTRDNRARFSLSVPANVELIAWLFDDKNRQVGQPCAQERVEQKVEIQCDIPQAGKYKLNVFGKKEGGNIFLCSVGILSK